MATTSSPTENEKEVSPSPPAIDQIRSTEELKKELAAEKDARREDRFIFIVVSIILLDVIFFTFMPNFGGPLAILVLQILILIPIARRLGMEEIIEILNGVITRIGNEVKR